MFVQYADAVPWTSATGAGSLRPRKFNAADFAYLQAVVAFKYTIHLHYTADNRRQAVMDNLATLGCHVTVAEMKVSMLPYYQRLSQLTTLSTTEKMDRLSQQYEVNGQDSPGATFTLDVSSR